MFDNDGDGSFLIENLKLSFFVTRVAKVANGASKDRILGTMTRCEAAGSKKTAKKYLTATVAVSSEHILRVFDPGFYMTSNNGERLSKLMVEHVTEAAEFRETSTRYLAWLRQQRADA